MYLLPTTLFLQNIYDDYVYIYSSDSVWPREITRATASFPPGTYKTQVTFGYIANPIWTLYPRRNLIKAPEKSN